MKGRTLTVFVSYRRSDVSGYAGRITDALGAALGRAHVFQDVVTIGPGVDFPREVDGWLARSDALLAIIGPGWLGARTADGSQRLFQDDDLVRMEVAHGLRSDVRVVPVLVGGATLPSVDELPDDLKDLATRQAVILRDDTFHQDVDRLVRSLRGEPTVAPQGLRGRRARLAVASGFVALALAAGGATWWYLGFGGDGRESGAPTGCPATNSAEWRVIDVAPTQSADPAYPGGGTLTFSVRAAHWRLEEPGTWLVVLDTQMQNNTKGNHSHGYYYYSSLRVAQHPFDLYCFDPSARDAEPTEVVDARAGFHVTCRPAGLMQVVLKTDEATGILPFTTATSPTDCLTS